MPECEGNKESVETYTCPTVNQYGECGATYHFCADPKCKCQVTICEFCKAPIQHAQSSSNLNSVSLPIKPTTTASKNLKEEQAEDEQDLSSKFSSSATTKPLILQSCLTPASSSSQVTTEIPPFVHFIWLGSPIPQKYLDNIEKWSQLALGFEKIYLWFDSRLVSSAKIAEQISGLKQGAAEIVQKDVASDLQAVPSCYPKEVGLVPRSEEAWYKKLYTDQPFPNWGAASDLLRVAILYQMGGLYCDTDVYWASKEPQKVLSNFQSPIGYRFSNNNAIINDFIACPAQSPLMLAYAQRQEKHLTALYADKLTEPLTITLSAYMKERGSKDEDAKYDARPLFTIGCTGPKLFEEIVQGSSQLFPSEEKIRNYHKYEVTSSSIFFTSDGTWYRTKG